MLILPLAFFVIDGDTFVIGHDRYRLYGIDAPEIEQYCGSEPCGETAKAVLERLLRPGTECVLKGWDRYGRFLADCVGVNSEMVRSGSAVAYRRYSLEYAADEDYARRLKLGIWAGQFISPEQWRHSR